jgi:hypothetical protein
VPLSATTTGLPKLPFTVRLPLSDPETVGVKVMLNVQLAPTSSEVPQVLVCV